MKKTDKYRPMFVRLDKALGEPDEAKRLTERHDIAKASAQSVIALTEYQDNKVARLLTIVAFLSAIVGAIFTRFQSIYPWTGSGTTCLTKLVYILFFVYASLVAIAATVLMTAIRPTFNVPEGWADPKQERPKSLFFYQKILEVDPASWATYWTKDEDMKARAAADYVGEAYLVADKVANKLQVAGYGVNCLIGAMCVLVMFVVATGISFTTVTPAVQPPTPTVSSAPTPGSQAATPAVSAQPHTSSSVLPPAKGSQ